MLRRSARKCTCRLAVPKPPATVIAKPELRCWISFLSGSRSMSTSAASCNAPRSTRSSRPSDRVQICVICGWLLTPENKTLIVGLPKEIKDNEYRVGLTPAGVRALKDIGHDVRVETNAGAGSGFEDSLYERAGATIVGTADDVWASAEMIVKAKEAIAPEYPRMRENQLLFTYLHLAPDRELTEELIKRKVTGIAYETITDRRGGLPLLTPMSEVAGRMAIQVGAHYLEKMAGGRGILLGGVPGVAAARVVIIGGRVGGRNAAQIGVGLGAHVTIIDNNL